MNSKAWLVFSLLFFVLLISSDVSARRLSHISIEENKEYIDMHHITSSDMNRDMTDMGMKWKRNTEWDMTDMDMNRDMTDMSTNMEMSKNKKGSTGITTSTDMNTGMKKNMDTNMGMSTKMEMDMNNNMDTSTSRATEMNTGMKTNINPNMAMSTNMGTYMNPSIGMSKNMGTDRNTDMETSISKSADVNRGMSTNMGMNMNTNMGMGTDMNTGIKRSISTTADMNTGMKNGDMSSNSDANTNTPMDQATYLLKVQSGKLGLSETETTKN